ncbi:hypothetical protein Tco_0077671 [Tanacetum coccineum]
MLKRCEETNLEPKLGEKPFHQRQHKQFLAFGLLLCLFGSSSPPFIMLESCEFAKLAICLGRSGSGGGGKGLSMVELGLQGKRDEEDP